ncbi:MAG: CDP-glycerol glycerophosphotransferase family protein [Lactobacillales bacterium]|jgi:CDP-glycerol glycerophosphotransferase|nr:CDP-glycerol glycerophosphotransferase family protein [Lactobacillales bacterium]
MMRKRAETFLHWLIHFGFWGIGKFPEKNLIIFESFHGKQYSDNPRAIYEYIRDHHPEYQCIWAVKKGYEQPFIENQVPYVERLKFRWLLTMPRAKYWVFNTRMPSWMRKSKETVYVQTWHGTPLKKLGLDIVNVRIPDETNDKYRKEFMEESARWDYLISPNAYSTKIFRQAFAYNGETLEIGYPRNDLLLQKDAEKIAHQIREKLGISEGRKIILYAPTWRDDEFITKGAYKFENHFPFTEILAENPNLVILTRLHYLVAEQFDASQYGNRVIDVSKFSDINQLYLISDLLITDYSSVMFDYALTKKPMLFFMYDKEKYQNETRGFYFNPNDSLPGEIIQNPALLVKAIKDTLEKKMISKNYEAFYQKFCIKQANASEWVFKKVMGEQK